MTQHGDVQIEDGGALWVMSGEIDAAVQARVEDVLSEAAGAARGRLVIDVSRVTFMDSGGLRLLYHAASLTPEPPLLRGVPEHIRDLLELTGVSDLFAYGDAGRTVPVGGRGADER
ncbi:STAS domain-containing protein [Puerhibacterium puerhi]|uniref:STAS domain-containing protein n=1 Tax=Puerhibacterium puerhi TaxID=2692623 RepID=UPI001F1D1BEB|nr:STAS domain-containing protein [Puerhibacterium puerhi]